MNAKSKKNMKCKWRGKRYRRDKNDNSIFRSSYRDMFDSSGDSDGSQYKEK